VVAVLYAGWVFALPLPRARGVLRLLLSDPERLLTQRGPLGAVPPADARSEGHGQRQSGGPHRLGDWKQSASSFCRRWTCTSTASPVSGTVTKVSLPPCKFPAGVIAQSAASRRTSLDRSRQTATNGRRPAGSAAPGAAPVVLPPHRVGERCTRDSAFRPSLIRLPGGLCFCPAERESSRCNVVDMVAGGETSSQC